MVVIIYMINILTTRENRVLSFNSIVQTRSYSNSKISKLDDGSRKGLEPNWVTGLVDAEGSFMVFIKLNTNNSLNLIRQIQLSFEISVHIKDIELLYKLKSFFGEAGTISIPSTRKDARLKITGLNEIFKFIIPHFKQYPLRGTKN